MGEKKIQVNRYWIQPILIMQYLEQVQKGRLYSGARLLILNDKLPWKKNL